MSNEIADEQAYVSTLYGRLDDLRQHASDRLRHVLATRSTSHQELSQRDATSTMYAERIAHYDAVANGLCFGRLDLADGILRYVGRIGIQRDSDDDISSADDFTDEPLLVDWRAPAARPFYLATVASPDGVLRRRHIRSRWREVVGVDDEVLFIDGRTAGATGRLSNDAMRNGDALLTNDALLDQSDTALDGSHAGTLVSEAALLRALAAERTGRMADIVETIQAEQDNIIRSDAAGVLVVDGGPGSGKTAVALHRAAYLLYHHREALAKRAVLIVGPNPTFLRYIGQVLPGLGETAVVLTTIGGLLPGVHATLDEPDATAEIKGRMDMAGVIARAIAERQRVPDEPWEIIVERDELTIEPAVVADARARARATRLPHNPGRRVFVDHMIHALAGQMADRVGADARGGPNLLTRADDAQIREELLANASVRWVLDELWPEMTPQRLLTDLYADANALEVAAPNLTSDDRELLRRTDAGGWTPADVPLLDEAADLLGVDDSDDEAREIEDAARREEYAEGVLEILSRDIDDDPEVLMAYDLINPTRLAERQVDIDVRTVAERAAADREWAYGHVIVDEAQELSAMAWRALMRRCPSRSMTLVGDVAQTSAPAGAPSWGAALAPFVADRWRRAGLSVNYRTPAEIMSVAADVLREIDTTFEVPTSIRSAGGRPWRRRVDDIAAGVRTAVDTELARLGDGRLAVLVPAECLAAVRAALPDAATGDEADLTARVAVLTVRQAKGLEFDTVLLVEPSAILAASPRGANDLYVAVTRATRRLGILYTDDVPAALASVPAESPAGTEPPTRTEPSTGTTVMALAGSGRHGPRE